MKEMRTETAGCHAIADRVEGLHRKGKRKWYSLLSHCTTGRPMGWGFGAFGLPKKSEAGPVG